MTLVEDAPPALTSYGLAPLWEIRCGDARELLAAMPAASVNCIVTSPPYFGLRDYGTARWEGGDPDCDHVRAIAARADRQPGKLNGGYATVDAQDAGTRGYRDVCGLCGGGRVDSQIGLERTVDAYVESLVGVFDQARRVLTKDGTLWLNLGDSYASNAGGYRHEAGQGATSKISGSARKAAIPINRRPLAHGLKPKDLIGVPWRVAFALQAAGWHLRASIIWAKPNPMPESVTDRPTRSHEMIFMLSQSRRYYYDAQAIAEPVTESTTKRLAQASLQTQEGGFKQQLYAEDLPGRKHKDRKPSTVLKGLVGIETRNARDVWTITPEPFAGKHFATFPSELARRCIVAGSPSAICDECGKPWTRRFEDDDEGEASHNGETDSAFEVGSNANRLALLRQAARARGEEYVSRKRDLGFWPTCYHVQREAPAAGVVLDPFAGSGTTVLTALNNGRRGVGLDLNPEYAEMARARIIGDKPLLNATTEGRII